MMEKALETEGMTLKHVIGPGTAHKYHPDSKIEINRIVDALAERGRDPYPRKVRFTTWTLQYNRMKWVTIDALDQHWERARLDAEIVGDSAVQVKTSNVTAFTLSFGPGGRPIWVRFETASDDQRPEGHGVRTEYGWIVVGFVSQNRR